MFGNRSVQVSWALLAAVVGAGLALLVGAAHGAVSEEPYFRSSGNLVFGFVPVGSTSAPESVTISNVGGGVLELTGAAIEAPAKREFAVVSNGCEGADLSSEQSCVITVTFHPNTVGTKLGSMLVNNTRGSCGKDFVALAGSAVAEAPASKEPPGGKEPPAAAEAPATTEPSAAAARAAATAHASDCLVKGPTTVVTSPTTVTRPVHLPGPAPCKSNRVVSIHVARRDAPPITRVNVWIDGHLTERRHGQNLTAVKVSLRGKPRARYGVTVTAIDTKGKRYTSKHYYVTCIPGH